MSDTKNDNTRTLTDLRGQIDAIDAEVHRLLIERSAIVGELIEIKGTGDPVNAFRPGREADMMRRLVAAHSGGLPITTVEHIWREIITTFTRLQAPFDIAVDMSCEPDRMRDLGRFYFGFSVNLDAMADGNAVVDHVGRNGGLGLVCLGPTPNGPPWWRGMVGKGRPRVMSHVPFIRTRQRPADLPALVISRPLSDPTPAEVRLHAVLSNGEPRGADSIAVLARHETADGWDSLIAAPADLDGAAIAAATGVTIAEIAEIGGIARGIVVDGPPSVLYAAANTLEAQ